MKETMNSGQVLLLDEIDETTPAALKAQFPSLSFIDARVEDDRDKHLSDAEIVYGFLPIKKLDEAGRLRWLQLLSAGVPRSLCPMARERNIVVTNLAGLYGPSIAEHTLTLMSLLGRNLHIALRNQHARRWDSSIAKSMVDLSGKTLAIVGLGNIGQAIARLAKSFGMRVIGCRRTVQATPYVDRVYSKSEILQLLSEGDFIVVAAALTQENTGWLGAKEFSVMKKGAYFVNVSRGKITEEKALLEALRSQRLAGAALDVFAVEPLPPDHPFWDMPQVIVSPHYSGDTVNHSTLPMERFVRNLTAWSCGGPLEGLVDLQRGY